MCAWSTPLLVDYPLFMGCYTHLKEERQNIRQHFDRAPKRAYKKYLKGLALDEELVRHWVTATIMGSFIYFSISDARPGQRI